MRIVQLKSIQPGNPFETSISVNRLFHVRYKAHNVYFYCIVLQNLMYDILTGFFNNLWEASCT